MQLTPTLLNGSFAICQLRPDVDFPLWVTGSEVWSLSRTPTELTAMCDERFGPPGVRADRGWRCLRLDGQFDLSMIGILASIADPLAATGVSIFTFSTFDTDYILVRAAQFGTTHNALILAGHFIHLS